MLATKQTETQNVLDHGRSVDERYKDLIKILKTGHSDLHWRLPTWDQSLIEYALKNQVDPYTAELYHLYHDCGKPYCLTIDEQGKRHFPYHADVSHQVFTTLFNNNLAAQLVRDDMLVHLAKADDVDHIASLSHGPTLVLTALAEVHSNADMFGGIESTSFKIKWKQVNKRGRQILEKHRELNQLHN